MKVIKAIIFTALVILYGCGANENELVIKGEIKGADKQTVYLQKMLNQQIVLIDSVRTSRKGAFKFETPRPEFPEFYFLKLQNEPSLTLLSDSGNTIVINSNVEDFSHGALITENDYSQRILKLNNRISKLRGEFVTYRAAFDKSEDDAARQVLSNDMLSSIKEFKADLGKEVLEESKSFYAYYILYQKISDDYLLFDPMSKEDSKYFAAVANVLSFYYPKAPRTKALLSSVKQVMAAQRSQFLQDFVDNAPESIPDITKESANGTEYKLSDLKGKLVILNYWITTDRVSRQWNVVLKSLYSKYKSQGLEIYQYSADKSKIIWEEALRVDKISWISVCDFEGEGSDALWKYNVKNIPSTFLISREGKLLGRFDKELELREAIKKNI